MTIPLPSLDTVVHLVALAGWLVCLVLLLQIRAACKTLVGQVAAERRAARLERYRRWLPGSRRRWTYLNPPSSEPIVVQDGIIDVDAYLRPSRDNQGARS